MNVHQGIAIASRYFNNKIFVPQTFNELLQKMTNKCFSKCVSKPGGFYCFYYWGGYDCTARGVLLETRFLAGSSLDNGETRCLSYCMDRYMDTWNIVSKTYQSRIMKERGS